MKALLLAAGLGTRLRPLTELLPKPLCLFYGRPMLDIVYQQIMQQGIQHIAINTHHLHTFIELHIQSHESVYTPSPQLSYEPVILGTGGAINPIRGWIGTDSLLICNGDIIADIDLRQLILQHQQSGADATMVLLDRHKRGTTPIAFEGSHIRAIGDLPVKAAEACQISTFSGVHIIGPRLLAALPRSGSPSVIDGYHQLLKEGAFIQAIRHQGFWEDLGTPRDYFAAHQAVFHHPDRRALCKRLGLPSAIVWDDSKSSALCGFGTLPAASKDSFFLGPIHGDATIQSCLVYPGVVFKPGQAYQHKIITANFSMDIV